MSIEIRHVIVGECDCGVPKYSWEHTNHDHYWECDYGIIPSFDIRNPAPLTITSRDFAHWVFEEGPQRISRGSVHTVTVTPMPDTNGDITATSEIRMFYHIEYLGRRWTWELLPAHWGEPPSRYNNARIPIYLGRWPD